MPPPISCIPFRQGAAVDFLLCLGPETRHTAACFDAQAGEPHAIPNVDPDRIYVMGYSLGGNVALHTAAMDDRVAGAASISGFTPYRTDTNDRPTGGIRRLYDLHALVPRLGLFQDDPSQVPYDYDEVLRAVAPRPTLVYAPTGDRDATFADVDACVKAAMHANLTHLAPTDDRTRMEGAQTKAAVAWAKKAAGKL